jgi:hypothetical protein
MNTNATLHYVIQADRKPVNYLYPPPEGEPWNNCDFAPTPVPVRDSRGLGNTSIHREGFGLWDAPSAVRDWRNDAVVRRLYYPEVVELACLATGAVRGIVFDHLVRQKDPSRPTGTFGREDGQPAGVGRVHNDYTEASGRRRLELVQSMVREQTGGDGPHWVLDLDKGQRYSVVNIWRSLEHPIYDTPLAVCDARSVGVSDMVDSEIRYPDRVGEIYLFQHNPAHRWHYFSAMMGGEALVFKQFDSQVNGVSRFTPHAAFDLPDVPADAVPRQSIEARCLVVYE